jgi:hypothetical protein
MYLTACPRAAPASASEASPRTRARGATTSAPDCFSTGNGASNTRPRTETAAALSRSATLSGEADQGGEAPDLDGHDLPPLRPRRLHGRGVDASGSAAGRKEGD